MRLCLTAAALAVAGAALGGEPVNRPGLPLRPEPVEAHLTDGSKLFVALNDAQIDVTTPYGKLRIKLADVLRIEFGVRVPPDVARKVETAVSLLESDSDKKADAWNLLTEAKEFAYPTLQRLTRHADKSIAARASEMAAKLRKSVPAERLTRIDHDVIHTEQSRIVGRVESPEFSVFTPPFGPRKIKLGALASLQLGEGPEADEVVTNVLPDPGYLVNYQQYVGKSFYFRVTGHINGTVWGTDIYTTDSPLAMAAVHAGVLKVGQTGIVKVTILPGQGSYMGSIRNGVSTSHYGSYPASYKVSRPGRPKDD